MTPRGRPADEDDQKFTVSPEPDVVRAYLLDLGHAEQWDPGTQRCERLDTGPVQLGSRWHNVSRFLGRTVELTYTLITADAARLPPRSGPFIDDVTRITDELSPTHAAAVLRFLRQITETLTRFTADHHRPTD